MNANAPSRSRVVLTREQMFKFAPSIFATTAHHSRSERFTPIPTTARRRYGSSAHSAIAESNRN